MATCLDNLVKNEEKLKEKEESESDLHENQHQMRVES